MQKIVLKDPTDKGVRKALNFGHTIGHAIESLYLNTKNELLHGEAIVIGMVLESHIALQKKLITKIEFVEIITVLHSNFELKKDLSFTSNQLLQLIKYKINSQRSQRKTKSRVNSITNYRNKEH